MKISIAMTTYNGSRFLDEQLKSIANQITQPEEMVVCDDASADGSCDIIDEFRQQAPFPIRLVRNEKNLGYTKNFEKAFSLCGGEIIVPADQDDVWYPQKLRRIQEIFDSNTDIGLVFSDADLVDEQGRKLGKTLWERQNFSEDQQDALRTDPFSVVLKGPVITGMTMAFRAKFLSKFLPISEKWHHDAWIALMMSLLTKIEPLPEILCAYRIHAAQQTFSPIFTKVPKTAKSERARRFLEAAYRYEDAWQYILSIQEKAKIPDQALSALQGKIRNKKIRAAVYSRRIFWHLIAGELIRGGYHHYASGWSGALGDLFQMANPRPQDY